MALLKDFTTVMPYIARDPLYNVEKPYSSDFDHGGLIKPCNHRFDPTTVDVKDIVDRQSFNLDQNGFCVMKARTNLSAEEALADKARIEDEYANEIEALLHQRFPEYSRIETINVIVTQPHVLFCPLFSVSTVVATYGDSKTEEFCTFQVRKRDGRYPSDMPVTVTHEQPGSVPHSDFSLGELPRQLELSFPGQWVHLKNKSYDLLK